MNLEKKSVIFETQRLVVRRYTADDSDDFFLLNGDKEVVRYIRPVKNREECNQFLGEVINYSQENPLLGRWAVDEKLSGRNIGMFAIIPVDNNTNKLQIGYCLLKDHWGKGYSKELTKEGIRYYFSEIKRPVLYAITETANIASQKVLLKCGFQLHETYVKGEKEVMEFVLNKNSFPDMKL